jgi:heat shock protein HslJ
VPYRRAPNPRRVGPVLAAVALIVLGGCGDDDTVTAPAASTATTEARPAGGDTPLPLPGTSWALESYAAGDAQTPAATGAVADLAFGPDGALIGSTGCNRLTGSYESVGEGQLTIQPGAMTQMACLTPELQAQEAAVLDALPRVAAYATTDDVLTLRDATGAVLLTYRPGIAGLEGTSWTATGVNNGRGAVEGTALTEAITASFGPDGTFTGSGGCNALAGTYATDGADGLTFTDIASGFVSCGPEVDAIEARYLTALGAVVTYEITGDMLTLRDADGAMQVVYRAAAP